MFKSKKSLIIMIVVLLIAAIAGWSAYYLKKVPVPKSSVPPVLNLTKNEGEKFQGVINYEKSPLIFATVSSEDVDSARYKLSESEISQFLSLKGKPSKIVSGAAYYYSPYDLAAKQIMALILNAGKSIKDNQFLIAYYNQSAGEYLINPPAEDDLQKIIFEESDVGSMKDDYIIKRFHPFVIFSLLPTISPPVILSAKVSLDEVNSTSFPGVNLIGTVEDVGFVSKQKAGWYLVPTHGLSTIDKFLEPIKNYVVAYYPQINETGFSAACYVGKPCEKDSGFNLVWLDIGDGKDVGGGKVETPSVPEFCSLNNCQTKIELSCNGVLCKKNKLEMTGIDMLEIGCLKTPKLCIDYGVTGGKNFGNFDDFLDKKFKKPGVIDPSPIENKIREMMGDPLKAGAFMGLATGPIRDKLDANAREKLGKEFQAKVGDGFTKLANEVMSKEFTNAFDGSALGSAYNTIAAYEKKTGTEVSKGDAAAFIGAILQDSLNNFSKNASTTVALSNFVEQAFSESSELKGIFSGALKATFQLNDSLFQGAGFQFDSKSGSFVNKVVVPKF